jgi:glycosyltransferase involved in cell wall biosynthesis
LVVVQILPALNNGGVERGTIEMANYLAKNGHTSIVISAGGLMMEKLSSTVEHITLNVGKKSLSSLLLVNKLKKLLIEKNVDIVHARSRLPAWLAYKAIARIKNKKPNFITTIHGLYSVKRYSSIMARGNKVIAVSQTAANYVMDNYSQFLKQKPHIIYRGIDPKEFSYGYQPESHWLTNWNKENPQLNGQKTVLLPGRLTDLKGVKDLLIWLKDKENDALLVLTAYPDTDKYAARLEQWFKQQGVEQKIKWVGFQKSMVNLYAVVDVVVSTSTRPESFGRTVVESLAVGTPVVGYNHGGVGEILGELFPQGCVEVGNTKHLSSRLNSVIKNMPQVPDKQTFILDNMLSQTLTVYQETINDR